MTEEWKALPEDQKGPYNDMHVREKEKYERAMQAYKEKKSKEGGSGAKEDKLAGQKRPASGTPKKGKPEKKAPKAAKEKPAKAPKEAKPAAKRTPAKDAH